MVYVYMEGPDSVPVDSYVDSTSHYSLLGVNTDIVIYEAFSIFAMGNEIWILRIANGDVIPSTFRFFILRRPVLMLVVHWGLRM